MKIYRHKKTNKPYLKIKSTKVKINGVWTDSTIYLCLYLNSDGMIWVRTEEDFKNNFK